jgi:hypothetical protein
MLQSMTFKCDNVGAKHDTGRISGMATNSAILKSGRTDFPHPVFRDRSPFDYRRQGAWADSWKS